MVKLLSKKFTVKPVKNELQEEEEEEEALTLSPYCHLLSFCVRKFILLFFVFMFVRF